MSCADLPDQIKRSNVVVLATDNEPTRFRINQLCVEAKTSFVVGRVFTRGIGGDLSKKGYHAAEINRSGTYLINDGVFQGCAIRDASRCHCAGTAALRILRSPLYSPAFTQ